MAGLVTAPLLIEPGLTVEGPADEVLGVIGQAFRDELYRQATTRKVHNGLAMAALVRVQIRLGEAGYLVRQVERGG